MNARSYKIIFFLLSFCILFILIFQGFWLRNFYLQKRAEFDSTVYSALEQLTGKLQERENLQAIKTTYFIQNGDTILKTNSRGKGIGSEKRVHIINHNTNHAGTMQIISLQGNGGSLMLKDSTVITGQEGCVNIIRNGTEMNAVVSKTERSLPDLAKESAKMMEQGNDVTRLVDKMMTEIKVLDTEISNPDTIGALIKKTLANKGLFMPVEFSLQKIDKKKKIIAQSTGFISDRISYKNDLSVNKIFNTHRFLLLQFPTQKSVVMAGMKSSLILSLIFLLIIMAAFYYMLRLIQNQKKLSDIKNDFVNNMTHELKTPIATISLAVDGMNHPLIKNDPEKLDTYTRILKEENQKLNRHVERVLQMALLDKGELQLHKKVVNLIDVIRKSIEGFSLHIQDQSAVVEFTPAEKEVLVYGDELHLASVFNNLLDNALKYCSENCKIVISVFVSAGKITVTCKDNGIGIDADMKNKIFEKFYRVQGGNLHDVKGFGLGLSYARSIVEEHHGSIAVYSEKGKGSEFIITLDAYAA